jgi:hypothetical protein
MHGQRHALTVFALNAADFANQKYINNPELTSTYEKFIPFD